MVSNYNFNSIVEYYFIIPIYTLMFVITLFILLGYYSFIAISRKKIRILLLYIPIILFILINTHSLLIYIYIMKLPLKDS